jgi:hypothetical protein
MCYGRTMHISHRNLIAVLALISLIFVTGALAFDRNMLIKRFGIEAATQETEERIAKSQTEFYRTEQERITNELKTKQDELTLKSSELDTKKIELNKTNQDLTQKIKELNSAKSQLTANAAELSKLRSRPPLFSFKVESSSIANIEQKKEDLKQVVTDAYDVMVDVYSQPYLLSSVTITFVDSFSNPNAGAEIVISNGSQGLQLTIKIKDFNKNDFNDVNAIIHEITHSFHGLAVLDPVAYEEGITVAATDAMMARLIALGKIPHFSPLYVRISSGDYANSSLSLPRNNNQFYSSNNTGDYYQLAGYGWYELYKADSGFFKKFNEKIYTTKRDGKEITETVVKDTLKSVVTGPVQGQSVDSWLQTKAFALH